MTKQGGDPFVRGLLEKLLQGDTPTQEELGQVLAEKGETTCPDFRSGKLSADRNRLKDTIREYVAAFANADGGILCVGPADVGDPSTGERRLVPLHSPSPQTDLRSWTRDIPGDLAPYLSPLPRILLETYSGGAAPGEMMLVAAARAPALVPLYGQSKRPVWWVRFPVAKGCMTELSAAVYLLATGCQPLWYQLTFLLKESGKPNYESQHEEVRLKRLYSERPLVALRPLP